MGESAGGGKGNSIIKSMTIPDETSAYGAATALYRHPVYQWLHSIDAQTVLFTNRDWARIEAMISEALPGFYIFMMSERVNLTDYEYRICLLFRLGVKPKECSTHLGVALPQVTRSSKEALNKLFSVTGKGKDLMKRLQSIE